MPRRPLLTLALAALLGACQQQSPPPAPEPEPEPQAQAPAAEDAPMALPEEPAAPTRATAERPRLQVTTVDGRAYDLGKQRGKWVVVNFWATWCKPCLKEMPELSALDGMREHIEVIGLAYEDIEPEDMRVFLQLHPVVYPVAIVDTYDPPKDFETPRGLPMTYLIAPDGKVAERFLGPVTAKDIETAIAKAGGPKPGVGGGR
ncbi:TlpA family protein disulfide reductase [Vulcaniibacterium tengchongense]|uniref:Thiol-disulfide isomerase/thioredoxin n=1 Tax=Vulcaniibacterium tengchongense TaxID=1273429 RepID=A0A3N4UXT9_9GAMM|nr:thiol-disulfide isomerase/thioredoxin [Vulcaniibacterium tengchongense]